MDVATRQAFWAAMRRYAAAGHTMLFATHYLEEADDFADRWSSSRTDGSSPTGRVPISRTSRVARTRPPTGNGKSSRPLDGSTIAGRLHLSEGTVRNYLSAAIGKTHSSTALRVASTVDASLLSPERQGRLLVDVARAHLQRRDGESALAALVEAERATPEQVHHHWLVRNLLQDLERAGHGRDPRLRELMKRCQPWRND